MPTGDLILKKPYGQIILHMSIKRKFSKIYRGQVDNIYRFVYLKVDSKETTEDLTSEIFSEFWKIYRRGADPASHQEKIRHGKAFLYRLARHKVADYYRGQEQAARLDKDEEIEDEDSHLEQKQNFQLNVRRLKQGLSKLKKNYQDLIIMFYINDLSVKEIAQSLEKSESAVKTGLYRAREALKEELNQG